MSIFKKSNEEKKTGNSKDSQAEKWPSVDEIIKNNEKTSSETDRINSKIHPKST